MTTLTVRNKMMLDFERKHWKYQGAKEAAITETFGVPPTRYYQELNSLIDRPQALPYAPQVVNRLRRVREARQRARAARRVGYSSL